MSIQDLQNSPSSQQLNTNLTANANRKQYKVMVVEDEEDLRDVFKAILENADPNWEVSSAIDGVDGLAKCEATSFDIVLLDIVMPNKDGIQTLIDIRANPSKYGDPIVLMLTNLSGDLAIEEAKMRGAQDYLVKIEYEPDQLISKVKEWLAKRV
jgi:two-component system chemotaxis response regulator CheY